jgi:hypothetical protein
LRTLVSSKWLVFKRPSLAGFERPLTCGSLLTLVEARIPRVACVLHGVRQTNVPWALPCTVDLAELLSPGT